MMASIRESMTRSRAHDVTKLMSAGSFPSVMRSAVYGRLRRAYERLLMGEVTGGPRHVAIIQDGNRRYARKRGEDTETGHRAGAETTKSVIDWCSDVGIEEVTLYSFSTENFERDPDEREHLFDLFEEYFRKFADDDRVHDNEVSIRAIGDTEQFPMRVRDAIAYVERRTEQYDRFVLNFALAYGGRNELLCAARDVAGAVRDGELNPADIDAEEIERWLYDGSTQAVDLIIRTGGDERTSNFLPWHANGNEAAVFFCHPYWPEFSKVDFLRAIRTYESREQSWRRTRARRALAIVRALGSAELDEAKGIVDRFREYLPSGELDDVDGFTERDDADSAAD